ncbi:MAG: S41 family peptidase [Flavobacteriales bacterium]|nr:S41 family peptidase [Flavobacteriales bacterium]MBK6944625.1 S41 family peptidase [Flavobacteriales bacterium]MBK9534279.1 S41 family peptidase [Flavobacteriales bacterium]MBP9137297.1 S41 family peptidase [Flavobacteriales bacterium]HQV50930.1 S41 family peptidase [Flavobacteriales bacterium]
MTKPRNSFSAYFPVLLAFALVAGLFIGRNMGSSSGGGLQVFNREASPSDKVGQVIDLIDRQYVDTVEKNELVDEVLQHMLQRLDPHSYYISAAELSAAQEPLEGSFDGIGVEFAIQHDTVVVISPVEGGPSEALGIRAGDRIIKADSVVLAGVEVTNDQVMKNLRGPSGSEVTVLLLRNGRAKPFEVLIKRGKIPIHSVAATLMTDDGTGYIKLVRFAKNTHEEFLAAAEELTKQGMKRLVLDLRGNGGGFLNSAILLADEFLPDGNTIVYTQGRNSPRRDITATRDGSYEKLPLAVLIDEGSASASEIIAGAIQDNDRGAIVGRRSFGKGLVQEHVDLPDHSAVRLTTARYYTPSGRSIQKPYGKGIDYEDDFTARYEHGELLSADSIHLDSTRAFTTLGGRTVYGGGGVMPDLFVSADTSETSAFLSELFFSGTLNQFAFDVADRDRNKLLAYGSSKAFDARYNVSSPLFDELVDFAKKQGVASTASDIVRSRKTIGTRLKASIARNVWGNVGYYGSLLESDRIFQEADSMLRSGQ